MKWTTFVLAFLLSFCNNSNNVISEKEISDSADVDTSLSSPVAEGPTDSPKEDGTQINRDTTGTMVYSNQAFRNVTVTQTRPGKFMVQGQAKVFEARFGWVVEDGHNELNKGFESADNSAAAWGNFSFNVSAQKKDINTTLHLVLFVSSMKDGARQHELPIPLY